MVSLEKSMFFLPIKYKIYENKVFVLFNLFVIPEDMQITKMIMNVPLPQTQKGTTVSIRKVASKWSEKDIDKGIFPAVTQTIYNSKVRGGQEEIIVDLTIFKDTWPKDRRNNNGVQMIYSKIRDESFLENNPPYLIVHTL